MRPVAKAWHLLPHDRGAIERLASALRVSPVVAQLLLNRRVCHAEAAQRFLQSPFKALYEPDLLPGVAEAADRLWAAIQSGRKICVYGDYDVDGLSGTSLLLEGLRLLGAQADFYVPHRLDEGYGLNVEALRSIAQSGAALVVTVDCGIASVAEAEEARRLGLELIVTDHHEFAERLPAADVIVHPRLPVAGAAPYPFGELSGSGVAFKLAWALCRRASGAVKVTPQLREYLLESVALASLGMIADVVPLLDENRIVVRHGLNRLATTKRVGLRAMLEACGLGDKREVLADDVAYAMAPRLNAAGRLGCARLVVELLTTHSKERAQELAKFLNTQNEQRQQIERRILAQVREQLASNEVPGLPALVLADQDWHAGVIGIVASRLVELYARPTLLIALREDSEVGHGSGRSVPGFHLHQALAACGEELLSHGGHAAAAGFKIRRDHIDQFRSRFLDYSARQFPAGPPAPRVMLDAEVPLSALTMGLLDALVQLEPYGAGNPRPRFLAGPVQVVGQPKAVGGGERHLSFRIRQDDGHVFKVIAFDMADRAQELLSADGFCCVAFTPSVNEYQGWQSVQLEVHDFQAGRQARLE